MRDCSLTTILVGCRSFPVHPRQSPLTVVCMTAMHNQQCSALTAGTSSSSSKFVGAAGLASVAPMGSPDHTPALMRKYPLQPTNRFVSARRALAFRPASFRTNANPKT